MKFGVEKFGAERFECFWLAMCAADDGRRVSVRFTDVLPEDWKEIAESRWRSAFGTPAR